MKTVSAFFALVGMGALLTSCGSTLTTTRVEVRSSGGRASSIEARIHEQANAYRVAHGKQELMRHRGLDGLARQHAEFMLRNHGKFSLYGKNVTHEGFENRVLIAQHRYNMETIGENVIAGERVGGDVGATLVRVWVQSRGHRDNLAGKWQATGIGVAVGEDGRVCATQLFGTPRISRSRWAGPGERF